MRNTTAALVALIWLVPVAAVAQDADKRAEKERKQQIEDACGKLSGIQRMDCMDRYKPAGNTVSSGEAKEQKLVADALNAGNAKQNAKDYAGAITDYQHAIDAAPKSVFMPQVHLAMAAALRNQAITAYNTAGSPVVPPFGATNDQIRAANKANAQLQDQKAAAAVPGLKRAIAEATTAATILDQKKTPQLVSQIQVELREDASLLNRLDRAATVSQPRPGIDTEVAWFRTWLGGSPAPATPDVVKWGYGVAAGLVAKDRAAGLALADDVYARTSSEPTGKLEYAELIAAVKLPAGDARRTKALADVTAITASPADSSQQSRAARLKTALSATT